MALEKKAQQMGAKRIVQDDDGKWEPVVPTFFRFEEPGEELVGTYMESTMVQVEGKEAVKLHIATEDGPTSCLATFQLEEAFKYIEEGSLVKIRYEGETTVYGGRRLKNFQVFKARK